VEHPVWDKLIELDSATQAISHEPLGMNRSDLIHQAAPHFDRYPIKIPLEPHDAGDATAMEGTVDSLHGNPWHEPQQIRVGLTDLLFPLVTRGIVCHSCMDRAQIVIEFPCVKEGSEVFSQIECVACDLNSFQRIYGCEIAFIPKKFIHDRCPE